MKNKLIALLILLCFGWQVHAQTDSLDVFRTPSNGKSAKGTGNRSSGNNALSLSLGHLGRGGTMITYERYINYTPFAISAGIGFMKLDFIGQFSFFDEEYLFENYYATRSNIEIGRTIDCGLKYMLNRELGGTYFGLAYSSYENRPEVEISSYHSILYDNPDTYKLNYSSKEFKVLFGTLNDVSSGFYNDFYIGTGIRLLEYQKLNIAEVDNPLYNSLNTNYYSSVARTVLDIKKVSKEDSKLWFFLGWKMGVRF